MLSDRPAGVVLERLGFRHVPHAAGEMYVPPPDERSEMTTFLHLASFAIFLNEEFFVHYMTDHPALPAEQITALLRLQAEENGSDVSTVRETSTLAGMTHEFAQRMSSQLWKPPGPPVPLPTLPPGPGLPARHR